MSIAQRWRCAQAGRPALDPSAPARSQDLTAGEAEVELELAATGARLLDEYAGQVIDLPDPDARLFAIVLDGIVISAPSISAPRFDGRAQIKRRLRVE